MIENGKLNNLTKKIEEPKTINFFSDMKTRIYDKTFVRCSDDELKMLECIICYNQDKKF